VLDAASTGTDDRDEPNKVVGGDAVIVTK